MWKSISKKTGSIATNNSYEGERIEEKVERFVNGGEAITDGAPMIYTERKDGVLPEYDIRTDRWEIAIDAMDYVTKSNRAKTVEMFPNEEGNKGEKGEPSGQSTQTSDGTDK